MRFNEESLEHAPPCLKLPSAIISGEYIGDIDVVIHGPVISMLCNVDPFCCFIHTGTTGSHVSWETASLDDTL